MYVHTSHGFRLRVASGLPRHSQLRLRLNVGWHSGKRCHFSGPRARSGSRPGQGRRPGPWTMPPESESGIRLGLGVSTQVA